MIINDSYMSITISNKVKLGEQSISFYCTSLAWLNLAQPTVVTCITIVWGGEGAFVFNFSSIIKSIKKCPGNFLKEVRHGEARINVITVACVLEKMVSILKPLTARPARKPSCG